jgi:hypothetical protein
VSRVRRLGQYSIQASAVNNCQHVIGDELLGGHGSLCWVTRAIHNDYSDWVTGNTAVAVRVVLPSIKGLTLILGRRAPAAALIHDRSQFQDGRSSARSPDTRGCDRR